MLSKKIRAAVFAAILPITSASFAAMWTGASGFPNPANDNWSNLFNWGGFSTPVSSPATDIIFGQSNRLTPIQDMGNDFVIRNLVFDIPGYRLTGASIAPAFIFSGSNALISNNISLSGNMTFAGEGSATLGGILSGTGGLIMNSQGQLTLNASNTFTGTTEINSGQIVTGAPDALAKSTVVINSTNGLNLNNHEFPTIGGLAGTGSLYLGDEFPNFDPAALLVGTNNASTTYSGTITTGGQRWLDKQGTGTLTLTGSGSSFYMIRVSSGAVILDGGSVAAAIELGDFGNITPLTIQNGAVVDSRGQQVNGIMGNSTVRVTGAGTIWRAGDTRLAFAQGTSGNAIFENGATITDSTKFIVGQGGPATLLLQSGATITTQVGAIGQNSPAVATATVTGAGSIWTNSTSLSLGGIPPGIIGGTGTLNINNGGQVISNGQTIFYTAPSAIKVNGGALVTGSLVSTSGFGSIDLIDPLGGTALTINSASGTQTYSGAITGTGGILKTGGSTQILSGNLTYLGPTTVNGGTLQLPQSDLGNRSFRADPGGTIRYNTPLITGGFLRGAGFHDFSQVQQIQGTTFGTDTLINQTTPLKLLNATISGTFNSVANLTADGVVISSAGTLNVLGAVTSSSLESNGVLRINPTRTLSNTGTLVLGGGSRTFIGDPQQNGGQLSVTGGTIELNGALLVNNGEISGTTNVNFGSLAKGAGKYGPVNLTDGGKFSPGNSPGAVTTGSTTWSSGGGYLFEINDAAGAAGINWDLWNITGGLSITAGTTTNSRFTISLASLTGANSPGDAANFSSASNYSWMIASTTTGISGFDTAKFTLDTSTFTNPTGGGTFALSQVGNNLFLNFTGVSIPPQWNVDASGSWSTASNWLPPTVPNGPTAIASFLGKITAPRTVTLDGNKQVQQINFNNSNAYTIAQGTSGTLTIGDGTSGSITVTNGSHEISAPIAFSGAITKNGVGTLTISGPQNHSAGAALSARDGQINLNSNAGTPATAASAAIARLVLTINNSGRVALGANEDLHSLDITFADAGAQQLNLNTPAAGFRAVHVYAPDLASAKTSLYAAMRNALGPGATDPTDGIFDSGRGLHSNSGIGLAQVLDAHGDPNIFIRLTRIGDLNLDGSVSISDFIDLAAHFNQPGTWQEGDLNYDGQVSISDFIDLASNFNSNYSGDSLPTSPDDQQTLSSFAAAHGVSVPEPGLFALLLPLAALFRRGRKSIA